MGIRPEREIPGHEPHDIVATDALVRLAALVDAVRDQQTLAEMPEGHPADVHDDQTLQIRQGHLRNHPSASFDLAGDGEPVPERSGNAVLDQQPLLLDVRYPGTGQ